MHKHKNLTPWLGLIVWLFAALPLHAQDDGQEAEAAKFNAAYKQYQNLTDQGKRDESLPYAKQALEMGEQLFGDEHKNTAALTYNYALNLRDVGRHEDSLEQMQRTLERYRAVYGEDSEELVTVYMDAGGVAAAAGQPQAAVEHYDRGLALVADHYGDDSEAYARLSLDAGSKLLDRAGAAESLGYLQKSHDTYEQTVGEDNIGTAASGFYLGKYYLNAGDNEKAEQHFIQVLPVFEKDPENGRRFAMLSHAFLVQAYEAQGQSDQATEHLLAIGREMPPETQQDYQPLYRPAPEYPQAAQGETGFVIVEFDVNVEGFVENIEVVDVQGHEAFEQPAVSATEKARFAPRFENGEPVATEGVRHRLEFAPAN